MRRVAEFAPRLKQKPAYANFVARFDNAICPARGSRNPARQNTWKDYHFWFVSPPKLSEFFSDFPLKKVDPCRDQVV
jgi:hypothetical protein